MEGVVSTDLQPGIPPTSSKIVAQVGACDHLSLRFQGHLRSSQCRPHNRSTVRGHATMQALRARSRARSDLGRVFAMMILTWRWTFAMKWHERTKNNGSLTRLQAGIACENLEILPINSMADHETAVLPPGSTRRRGSRPVQGFPFIHLQGRPEQGPGRRKRPNIRQGPWCRDWEGNGGTEVLVATSLNTQ